jgi:hypothetical protein
MSEIEQPQKTDARDGYARLLGSLFSAALSAAPFDALCTLLRVGGMADANWDPFEESRAAFEDYNWMLDKAGSERSELAARRVALLMYCQAVEMTAPHEILANLLRCVAKKSYTTDPFSHLGRSKKGRLFSWVPPSAKQKFQRIKKLAVEVGHTELVVGIDKFLDERVRNAFSHSDYILTDRYFRYTEGGLAQQIAVEKLDRSIADCFAFYGAFLYLHKEWLRALGRARRFHKWPNYEVLEVLSSDEEGVFGFHVHFSNGSLATYTRRKSGIEAINVMFENDGGINFMVGQLDRLEPVWKINGKPVEDWSALP